jgi:ribosome-binding protein aMBF1 (putative translation factor)
MPQFGNLDFNDYEPLIIRGKNAANKKKMQREGKTETKAKNTHSEIGHKMRKIEQSNEVEKIKTINSKVKNAIIAGRTAKKMNRKQLALAIQENVKVVEQYENGKAIPNIKIINKFQKALGIKLTGAEFK